MRPGSEALCQFSIRVMLLYVKGVPDQFAGLAPKRNEAKWGKTRALKLPLSSLQCPATSSLSSSLATFTARERSRLTELAFGLSGARSRAYSGSQRSREDHDGSYVDNYPAPDFGPRVGPGTRTNPRTAGSAAQHRRGAPRKCRRDAAFHAG